MQETVIRSLMDLSPHTQLTDLVDGNTARLEAYISLFLEVFPQYASVVSRLKRKATLPSNSNPLFLSHQWLLEIDHCPVGLCSFKYSPGRNLALVVFIAVAPAYRQVLFKGVRLSEWLITKTIEQIKADACSVGKPEPLGLVLEVEPSRLVERYQQFGFVLLPVDYYEPYFEQPRQGNNGPEDMNLVNFKRRYLGVFPVCSDFCDFLSPTLIKQVVDMLAVDHYHLPPNHWSVEKALQSIQTL